MVRAVGDRTTSGRRRTALALLLAIALDVVVVVAVPSHYPTNVAGGIMLFGVVAATSLGGRSCGLLAAGITAATFIAFFVAEQNAMSSTTGRITGAVVYTMVAVAAALVFSKLEMTVTRLRRTESDLNDSLTMAQRALLPGPVPSIDEVQLGRCYRPAGHGHAGGDWYTIVPLGEHRIGLGIGDAAGHGLTGLSVMARTRFGMLAYALLDQSPASVLEHINSMLCSTAPVSGRFVTATFGVLDRATMSWTEARAGHPPTACRRADGTVDVLNPDHHGLVLGIDEHARYSDVTVQLEPGDTIALYTDGLIERPTQSLDVGIAALSRALASRPGGDLDEFCSLLADELGSERDDVALLVATVESAPEIASSYRTSLPADARQIAVLRHELEGWFEQQKISSDDRWALTLATGELATNAIEHGCAQDGVSLVTVEARRRADVIEISVHDPGIWTSAVRSPDRGRGLGMVNTVTDQVTIESGAAGTTVRIKLELNGDGPRAWVESVPG
jgi:serine phosphatase RsbU (regulator of sigma subunit)/anti-sigma regulatory factor (Ser/Thr protein kinase)